MELLLVYGDNATRVPAAALRGDDVWLSPSELTAATGWSLESAGLCKDDACVQTQDAWVDSDGSINLSALAAHLGQPCVRNESPLAVAFGESVAARRSPLTSNIAPDFSLPDLDGNMHSLSDFRGKKVFMYSWGSY